MDSRFKGAVLTIGNFDGVHLGHKELVNTVIQYAKRENKSSVLYTFFPHPAQILYPEKNHKYICSFEETSKILRSMSLDHIIVEPFTKDFSRLPPERFIEEYIVELINPTWIVVGYDFRFGTKGRGSIGLLEELSKKHNFRLKVVPPVKCGDIVISSSAVKEAILSGKWDLVPLLLGRPFSIKGFVVKGKGRGRGLGFPTINLKVNENSLLPLNGVYIARAVRKNESFYAVINIGVAPTFSDNCLKKIEVHLIGKREPWKDKECEVEVLKYIRPERKYSSAKELALQITQDIDQAKKYFRIS